jgi:hypothetical protein
MVNVGFLCWESKISLNSAAEVESLGEEKPVMYANLTFEELQPLFPLRCVSSHVFLDPVDV